MAVPTAPYCTSGDVYLTTNMLRDPARTDFTEHDTPPKSVVEYWIDQVATQIDMAYSSAGYVVPFEEASGETWPTFQTEFLRFFNAVGVAAQLGGDAGTPRASEFIRGEKSGRSPFEYAWMNLIEAAEGLETRKRGRRALLKCAATETGSVADHMLSRPSPPLTDFLEGYRDPTRHDGLRDFTNRHKYYFERMNSGNEPSILNYLSIDYMYLLHVELGYTYAD